MQQTLLILPILVSVAFWAAYHYHKDRHLPEPAVNLALCFVLGLGSSGLARLIYAGLEPLGLRYDAVALAAENPLGLLLFALFAIGPIEELAKLLPFVFIAMRFKAFDEPLDGIVYASFIALGYAAAENVYYAEFLNPTAAAARAFASPVVHILFASIWAHWITQAWLSGKPLALPVTLGFVISAVLHGGYDFLVLLKPVMALPLAATMIAAIWVWRLFLMRRLHRESLGNNTAGLERKQKKGRL